MNDENKLLGLTPTASDPGRFANGKEVRKKYLINKLNYINFQDDVILVNFKHLKYNHTVSYPAKPQPCLGEELKCLWTETEKIGQKLSSYRFQEIVVPNGKKILLVTTGEVSVDDLGIRLVLPETCWEVSLREMRRYSCKGVNVQFIQNSAPFYGVLVDFSTASFRVEIAAKPPQTFQWIDPNNPVTLIFSDENKVLFSGECKIIKQDSGHKIRSYVLVPAKYQIQRFRPKEFRNVRQKLVPSPTIIFKHPLIEKMINLKIIDLSGSGFSVEEDRSNAVLLPGMIIPDLELNFANNFSIKCKAQVVYRQLMGEEKADSWVKCGMAVLDMNIEDHGRLSALLHQAKDDHSSICNRVNMDDLWDFFFESGFIYPQKYAFLEINKEKIKSIYKKLYTQNQKIARHFIYQEKGRIQGHVAMIRFYENAWLIHHHAAREPGIKRSGIAVLDQVGRFSNASHSLYSLHMDYLFCYFRPENKFPNRVFGGVAKEIKNPKASSLNTFAYFHNQKGSNRELHLPKPWELIKTKSEDLLELEEYYEHRSGGLMLDALDMKSTMADCDDLSKEYQQLGFKKEKYLFSLKNNIDLMAIFMVNISDVGLNLSDLTNCIKVFVLDSNGLPKNILFLTLSSLSAKFEQDEIPVMIYPVSYAEIQSLPYEKLYRLWVLNTQYGDQYFKCLKTLFGEIGS
jgi:hypothetical protein